MRRLLLIFFIFLSTIASSQDTIYTKNSALSGRIIEETSDTIFFKIKEGRDLLSKYVLRKDVLCYKYFIIEKLRTERDSLSIYTFIFQNKMEIQGTIKEVLDNSIVINSEWLGEVTIDATKLEDVKVLRVNQDYQGKYWFPNPNLSRYFFCPSAYNLKKGEGYYQNAYVFLNMFNVGLTDYFSVGGGFEFVSTFTGEPIVFITPKIGFQLTEKFRASSGFIGGVFLGEEFGGLFYGIGTYGNIEKNISFGAGYGFIDRQTTDWPVFTLSGMSRIGRRVSFVSENWFIPSGDNRYYLLVSYGVRLFGPKMSFDLAFFNNEDVVKEIFIGIPYVDFVIKF